VRGRAQAENALVLLIGEPLPADLPQTVRLGAQPILATSRKDCRRTSSRAVRTSCSRSAAAIGERQHRRRARRVLPAHQSPASSGSRARALGIVRAGTSAWSVAPSLTVPIFSAGALAANLDVAKIQKDIGIAQYEKAIQVAFREVSDGLAARGTFDDQVAATERYTAAQERALQLSDFRYRNGGDSYLTVLTAQTGYYNAQLALVSRARAPHQPRRPLSGAGRRLDPEDRRRASSCRVATYSSHIEGEETHEHQHQANCGRPPRSPRLSRYPAAPRSRATG